MCRCAARVTEIYKGLTISAARAAIWTGTGVLPANVMSRVPPRSTTPAAVRRSPSVWGCWPSSLSANGARQRSDFRNESQPEHGTHVCGNGRHEGFETVNYAIEQMGSSSQGSVPTHTDVRVLRAEETLSSLAENETCTVVDWASGGRGSVCGLLETPCPSHDCFSRSHPSTMSSVAGCVPP